MTIAKSMRRWRVSVVSASVAVSVAALLLALFGFVSDLWAAAPIAVRFMTGVVVFGLSPGLLLVGPFLAGRRRLGAADFAISVLTCSFSCNLAVNVVLFQLQWSLTEITRAYVVLQVVGYALWAVWTTRRAEPRAEVEPELDRQSFGRTLAWTGIAVAAAAAVYVCYVAGAPPTNPEELVWLRKLVDNPAVRFDNLSYRNGDPSTYLFVPFQIFTGGASVIAQADVVLVYSLFFAVTTALSLFVIAYLAYVVFGAIEVALVTSVWMLVIVFLDPNTVIATAGIVAPYPNRYGFAGGVLLPLILLLFWSVLRDPSSPLWRWALLVYVTVEMTFVHARETLLAVGVMATVLAILAIWPRLNRRQIGRIAFMIAVTAVVLVTYRRVNLAIAPELGSYVDDMSSASKVALAELLAEKGPMGLLGAGVPGFADVSVDGDRKVTLTFGTYQRMFVDTWGRAYLGRLYLAVALLLLPLCALAAASVAEMSLIAVVAGLCLITSSGFLTLFLSAVVGSPEVLIAYNLIALFSVLILCGSAWSAASALARALNSKNIPMVAVGVVILVAAFLLVNRVVIFREYLFGVWKDGFGLTLTGLTVAIVGYRLWRQPLPLFRPASSMPTAASTTFVACCLVGAVLMPAVTRSQVWGTNPFAPAIPASRYSGNLLQDYELLVAGHKLDPSAYPVSVVRFLREEIAPGRTLYAADALALMQTVPHFAAILSNKGSVAPNYIVNLDYLRKYSRTGTDFSLHSFFASEAGLASFPAMLADYCIDVVVAGPEESAAVRQAWEATALLQGHLQPLFDQDGFIIYRAQRPATCSSK